MSDFTPTPEAVEAVAKALMANGFVQREVQDGDRDEARRAIAAFVEAEKMVWTRFQDVRLAEAERDRLADRVAELEFKVNENFTAAMRANARLQRATEALRKIERKAEQPVYETQVVEIGVIAHSALAALAGEDDAQKPPQREGDYL